MIYQNILITKLDHFGRGIAYINNKITFIKYANVSDIVDVKITKENSKYQEGININYINNTDCKYYLECGGCNILHMPYLKQLEFKQNKVKEIVNRFFDIDINDIKYSEQYNYRNKIILHVSNKKIGFYKSKTSSIIDIDECIISDKYINKIINDIKDYLKDNDIEGNIKIRYGDNYSLVSIIGKVNENIKDFLNVDVLIINGKCLSNRDYIIDKIDDLQFKVSDNSFFQINKTCTSILYNEVINFIKDKNINKALDLYCGCGTITLKASKYVNEIVGIEIIEDAINDANFNKELNNITNASFICGKVEDNIDKFNNIDLVITDPPRSGMDNKTIDNLLRINSKYICYVSCEVNTMVRDLNLLKDKYNILSITPVDMFPNTYHCESVVILERK